MADDGFGIGIQGNFGRGMGYSSPAVGDGFRGAAKRVERVREALLDFLFNYEAANTDAVGVTLEDGIATLSGSIASTEDAARLIGEIRRIPGVTGVNNYLRIESPPATKSEPTKRPPEREM